MRCPVEIHPIFSSWALSTKCLLYKTILTKRCFQWTSCLFNSCHGTTAAVNFLTQSILIFAMIQGRLTLHLKKLNTGFLFFQHARQKSLVAVIDRKESRKEARQTSTRGIPPTITLKRENINWIGVAAWRDRSSIHENMSIFHLVKSW